MCERERDTDSSRERYIHIEKDRMRQRVTKRGEREKSNRQSICRE